MLASLQYVEIAQKWLLRGFVLGWVFFLGSCFASFLNVVAWRLPRGRGILGNSKCPFCNNKLSFTSNMPIVGWLSSGGRCRSCKLPISSRYLFVEIALGAIFLAIVCVELFCGGVSLPTRTVEFEWGIERLVFYPKLDLIQIVAYHLILMCLIFVGALVRLERKPIPMSILIFGLITGLAFKCLWPWTQLTPWQPSTWPLAVGSVDFLAITLVDILVGVVTGFVVWISNRNRETSRGDLLRECLFGFVLVGLFLGHQFAISVALTLLLFDSLLAVLGDFQSSLFWTSPIFKTGIFCVALLLIWRLTSQFEFWPGPNSSFAQLGIAMVAILILAFLNSMLSLPGTVVEAPSDKASM